MLRYGYGVDVGGTEIKFGFFTEDGELIEKWSIPTRINGSDGREILSDIAKSVNEHRKTVSGEMIGAGIGVPGPVIDDRFVPVCENLYWRNVDAADILTEYTGLRVVCLNDANAAALGEMWKGSASGYRNSVFITLGTGVGCGVIQDGRLMTGAHGTIAEIGHIPVEPHETEPCSCGKYGCLEQYASASGLARIATRYLENHAADTVLTHGEITSKTIWDAYKNGDKAAGEILEIFGDYLGRGIAIAANMCDPEIFIIGGGMSNAGNELIELIRRNYLKYVFRTCSDTEFMLAKLGNDAGAYGCMYKLLAEC